MVWDWYAGGQKEEYQPRRLFGQQGVDFQERVNFDRLRRERLEKLQAEMQAQGMPALLLTQGENIRYATATRDLAWKGSNQTRYALVFAERLPILFETPGIDTDSIRMHAPWIRDRLRPMIHYLFTGPGFEDQLKRFVDQISSTLKEEGVSPQDKIGVDVMDFVTYQAFVAAGVNIVPGGEPIRRARLIKTRDELELLKQACAISDCAINAAKEKFVYPGAKESEVVGEIVNFCYSRGHQWVWAANCASGGNTNPYLRAYTDKIIRKGDMVIIDMGIQSYLGYMADFVRAWPCHSKFTREQKELYQRAYEYLQRALQQVKPGNTTADIARAYPADHDFGDGEYRTTSLVQFGHTLGLGLYEGFWISRGFSLDHPITLEPNMFLAIETYCAKPGGEEGVRLEDELVVTDKGYQVFSLIPFEEEAIG